MLQIEDLRHINFKAGHLPTFQIGHLHNITLHILQFSFCPVTYAKFPLPYNKRRIHL